MAHAGKEVGLRIKGLGFRGPSADVSTCLRVYVRTSARASTPKQGDGSNQVGTRFQTLNPKKTLNPKVVDRTKSGRDSRTDVFSPSCCVTRADARKRWAVKKLNGEEGEMHVCDLAGSAARRRLAILM